MKVLAVLYKGGKHAQEEPRVLGSVENELGLRSFLEQKGHELIVTDDKEGAKSQFVQHIKDAEILITTPFHPAYATREILDSAKNLKLAVTAGVGSDHVDLDAANEHKIDVLEVTGSNVVSVAEHVIMDILVLVRNYEEGHKQALNGEWEVSKIARNAFDLENKVIGTVGSGRIGFRVLQRLKPFQPKELLYFDYKELPAAAAKEVGVRRVEKLEDMLAQCDVVTINAPLHDGTRGLFNKELLSKMKKGAYLVNTARGAICVDVDVAEALKSGHLNGYAGDVWPRQPAPSDHCWRTMRNPLGGGNGMTPHYSGTTLDAQKRYADGTKDIIERYLEGKEQEKANVIVTGGKYASEAYGQR